MDSFIRSWFRWVSIRLRRGRTGQQFYMLMTATAVGLLGGLGTILLHELINLSHEFFFDILRPRLAEMGAEHYALVLLPLLGGLIVGLLAWKFADPHSSHGVAYVIERVMLFGGHLHFRPIITRVLGSVITLGSGGSAGPEDPSVQVGSMVGSGVARRLRLSADQTRTLVGCGAAAGIASAFNAPLAGAFFAMEIILRQFQGLAFAMIVISAVVSAVTTQIILGRGAAFAVPAYTFVSFRELWFYLLLGIAAAFVAVAYIQSLYRIGDHFHGWDIPLPLKAGFGGLLVGMVGLFLPQVMGQGYPELQTVLNGQQVSLGILAALVVVKILATSVTLGSGGMGGVFAPSLFVGAMLGALFGEAVNIWFPSITAPAPAYAMVGMAAVLAGAVRSPITAIMLLFEMTNDFRILLPLIIAVIASTTLTELLGHESVYTWALLRRGLRLEFGHEIDVMQGVRVNEVMDIDPPTVPPDLPLAELERILVDTRHHGLPVVDSRRRLVGIVTLQDLERAMQSENWQEKTVGDIATTQLIVAYPDEPMWMVLKRMGSYNIGRIPVVSRKDPTRLRGMVWRTNIVRAYNIAIRRRAEMQEWAEEFRLGRLTGKELLELTVAPGSFADGRKVRDLPLPAGSLLTAKREEGLRTRLVHGDDELKAGDVLMALADRSAVRDLRRLFELPMDQAGVLPSGELKPLPMALFWKQPVIGLDDSLGSLRAVLVNAETRVVTHLVLSYRVYLQQQLKLIPFHNVSHADVQGVHVKLAQKHLVQLPDYHLRRLSPSAGDISTTLDYTGPWLVQHPEEQALETAAPDPEAMPLRWQTRVFTQSEVHIGRVAGCMVDPTYRTLTHLLVYHERLIPRWIAINEADVLEMSEPLVIIRLTPDEVNQLPPWNSEDYL
ncbi:MAG: CBS domain-containing protein [Chloroflexi bacterium]|nr:MAG: CBS domain-containing protein [Chloroflexota bacterium]